MQAHTLAPPNNPTNGEKHSSFCTNHHHTHLTTTQGVRGARDRTLGEPATTPAPPALQSNILACWLWC